MSRAIRSLDERNPFLRVLTHHALDWRFAWACLRKALRILLAKRFALANPPDDPHGGWEPKPVVSPHEPSRRGRGWERLAALALIVASNAWAESVSVDIVGVEDEVAEAIRASMELQLYVGRDVTAAQVRRLFARAEKQIHQALEPFGYYNATVQSDLEPVKGGFRAVFRITPGEPVIVRSANVQVIGPGSEDPSVRAALQKFEPKVGGRLVHEDYENSKSAIETALFSRGYLDARPITRRVEVTRATNTARIDLIWQTGQRYRLGAINFSGAQFSDEFLQRFVPWREGAYYSSNRVLSLQERLVASDYFSSVAVNPRLADADNGVVPVDVLLIPAKRNAYLVSAFYGTDSGPGVNAMYERRWLNERGHKLRLEPEYSQRVQSISTSYRIPLLGPQNRSYNFGVRYRDEDTDTSESRVTRVVANETREWRGLSRTLGLQFISGDFEVGGERGASSLLFPEAVFSLRRADDFVAPRRGISLSLALRAAQEGILSETTFAQVRADAKWIRAIAERQRVILRGSLGTMTVEDFSELPPELRFFAGGDRSVRGYDYQAIGSLNQLGEVIGGEHLVVGSAEYEYYFTESWGAAAFVDAGDAFDASRGFRLRTGAGVGIRWRSPVGLVRVDFAKPLSNVIGASDGIRFHVVIGPDL